MPIYRLRCDECEYNGEEFHRFSDWDKLKKGQTPFSKKCPECGSSQYNRVYDHLIYTETSFEQRQEKLKKQMADDKQKLQNGDIDFIRNIAGDKPIDKNLGGQKYMKDVKRGIKKR